MSETVHTFPVPDGWSPEQAWEHHTRGHLLPDTGDCTWTIMTIAGGERIGRHWIGGRLVTWEVA